MGSGGKVAAGAFAVVLLSSARAGAQAPFDQGVPEPPAEAEPAPQPPAPAPVPAAPVPAAPPAPVEMKRVWYGWQPLFADLIAVAVTVSGASSGSGSTVALGAVLYVFPSPFIHAAHKDGGAAAGSFALRVGLPLAAGGLTVGSCHGEDCFIGAAVVGGLTGLVAIVIDAAALSWETVPVTKPKALRVLPVVVATPAGDATVGVHGMF